jgi:hypothetical protein
MPSTSIVTKISLAATLIVVGMIVGNYTMFSQMSPADGGGAYVYEAAERPREVNSLRAQAQQEETEDLPLKSSKGPAGAQETIRLSFSAHLQPASLKENTPISVYLVKEVGVAPAARVMLFTLPQDTGGTGVISTRSRLGESGKAAALRALADFAAVNPVPDLDFITPVGATSDGHSVYVAYIRQERLHLKGRLQPAEGKWISFKDVQLSHTLEEATVDALARSLASHLSIHACLQGLARAYLNPWFKTAGLPAGSCG